MQSAAKDKPQFRSEVSPIQRHPGSGFAGPKVCPLEGVARSDAGVYQSLRSEVPHSRDTVGPALPDDWCRPLEGVARSDAGVFHLSREVVLQIVQRGVQAIHGLHRRFAR